VGTLLFRKFLARRENPPWSWLVELSDQHKRFGRRTLEQRQHRSLGEALAALQKNTIQPWASTAQQLDDPQVNLTTGRPRMTGFPALVCSLFTVR